MILTEKTIKQHDKRLVEALTRDIIKRVEESILARKETAPVKSIMYIELPVLKDIIKDVKEELYEINRIR